MIFYIYIDVYLKFFYINIQNLSEFSHCFFHKYRIFMSVADPESFHSNEEVKESSYMTSFDRKVLELASQNNFSQIKKIFCDETQEVNLFISRDHKDYTSTIIFRLKTYKKNSLASCMFK